MQDIETETISVTPARPEPVDKEFAVIRLDVQEADALYEILGRLPAGAREEWLTPEGQTLLRELKNVIEAFSGHDDVDPGRGVYYG